MKRLSRIVTVATLALMKAFSPALASRGQPDHAVPLKGRVLALDSGQIFPTPEEPCERQPETLLRPTTTASPTTTHLDAMPTPR